MKDFASVKARYLRDPIPVRLGGLAADLARIGSASANAANGEAVHVLLEETRRFIEWTAAELDVDVAGGVLGPQLSLALFPSGLPDQGMDTLLFAHVGQRADV